MDIPVYSFIAKSGTGKTTLIEKLIPELKAAVCGWR
jgi:molybdopterin-guanine dinucleotide biosynthesis protein